MQGAGNESKNGHAVVVGGSLGGLMTAQVLAERFDRVTIIERDTLPDGPTDRKGVPQGRHAHGLLHSGELVMRDLFPGLIDELVDGGAQRVHWNDSRWWIFDGYRVDHGSDLDATFFSRPFLENGVRRRVLARPDVTLVPAAVRGLKADSGRVVGVEIEDAQGRRTLPADFVVDTSGRGSQASAWLEALGYEAPPVDQVRMNMAYASRTLKRVPGQAPEGAWYVTMSTPPTRVRGAVLFPIEGDRWIVTLLGFHGDFPPTDDEGFLEFARSLPTQDVANILAVAEPDSPIVPHKMVSSQWRHYDKVRRAPAGFVALGDSICSFNPAYGQGMSSAALQVQALAKVIDQVGPASPALPKKFYKAAKKVILNPWQIAAGADFLLPETTGAKPPGTDVINKYIVKVFIAAQRDEVVNNAMIEVQNLLAPPPSLMKPKTFLRVMRASKLGPTGTPTQAATSVTSA